MTDKLHTLLTRLHGIHQEKKLLKCQEDQCKAELDALYELGDVGKQVADPDIAITVSRSRTTTYQHSQSVREDIEKLKMMDIELGHAKKKETHSWTVRLGKPKTADD